ncbi:hypothetical protein D7Y13_36855 [Corallococcus praedator]|uniref:Uncharacterized protein n=1 Tax=Corallococcus praedator TaxID=2316724 RepID=A0ABX9Q8T7_9BACT|nr:MULTISPECIES: hypothetical protein [Corallococcus]RKH27966.1 hypothetical protein D7X75_25600 [Corallococcus sp. CA031C]RKH92408.1 hypothetical protein D7Y13_36855 [Corallococcus praedator]
MPNLDALLKDTMLLTAAPGAPFQEFGGDAGTSESAASPSVGDRWAWTHDLSNAGRVTHLTYDLQDTPWYAAQTVTVLDELVWHPIELVHRGMPMTLELSKEFLLRKYEASQGSIHEEPFRYWIPATLDRSMMLVFGFQVNLRGPAGAITLEPIPRDVLSWDDFMPPANPPTPPKPPVMKVKRTEMGTLRLTPLRVLVCAEFVCCTERNDYTPGNMARTSRFRPHLMLMSNRPLDKMAAKISIRRPPMTTMAHQMPEPSPGEPPHDPHAPHDHHGAHEMSTPARGLAYDQDEMVHEMATGMWSDSNTAAVYWRKIANVTFPPLWSSIFSRVSTDLPAGTAFLMASPDLKGGDGFNANIWSGHEYKTEQQQLMNRQGYFDNIHVAPPMRAPKSVRDFVKNSPLYKLDAIAMAPFCIHDCLHMHWRWLPAEEKWLWGWDETGPYKAQGEPHIPVNQHLRVELESTHAFAYCVRADTGLEAGHWQYILHEGLAYGNTADKEWLAKFMLGGMQFLDNWPAAAKTSWAMFYWFIRHWHLNGVVRERLLEDGAPVLPPYP